MELIFHRRVIIDAVKKRFIVKISPINSPKTKPQHLVSAAVIDYGRMAFIVLTKIFFVKARTVAISVAHVEVINKDDFHYIIQTPDLLIKNK
jgi:hypothetical protein